MWPSYNMRELSGKQHMLANVTGRTEDFQLVSNSLVPQDIWNGRDSRTVFRSLPFLHTRQKHTCTRHIWCLERVFMDEGLGILLNLSDSQCLLISDGFKPACAVLPPLPWLHHPLLFSREWTRGTFHACSVLTGIDSRCSLPSLFSLWGWITLLLRAQEETGQWGQTVLHETPTESLAHRKLH